MNQTILLVEDQEDDAFFLKNAFTEAAIPNPVQVAQDGREAMDYLSGNGKYSDREQFPLPCLLLLDLKLPRVMGLEVLKWLRGTAEWKSLIVIVLTSSALQPDIQAAYALGANAYLVKPTSPKALREIALRIKMFWLEINHGPAIGRPVPRAALVAPLSPTVFAPKDNFARGQTSMLG